MQGFHRVDEYYELCNLYCPDPRRNTDLSVMVNEGADIEQAGASKAIPCHGSASSSQEEEQGLISLDRHHYYGRPRSIEDDPQVVKTKLQGFYCVSILFCVYTVVYFTYLIIAQ